MKGKHQLARSASIAAPAARVWDIISDSRLLPRWAAPVLSVACRMEGPESVGSVRECQVSFAGRRGTIVERCVDLVPGKRAGYVVDDDSLGFRKMFADYGFTITLEPNGSAGTTVRMDTYYTPRNPLFALMNALMMRRRFGQTVESILGGLRGLAESNASLAA